MLDPKLVFAIVDNFFGGVGRHAKIEGREFTATEMRVVHMFLRSAFADMKEAWQPIANIDVEYLNSEINPNFASIVTPVGSRGGVPVPDRARWRRRRAARRHAVLDDRAAARSARLGRAERSRRTGRALARVLKDGLQDAEVELTTLLGSGSVTLQQLVDLQPGDVLPCDFTGKATVLAEGVPLFRGAFGVSRGQQCVRYEQRIRRPDQCHGREAAATRTRGIQMNAKTRSGSRRRTTDDAARDVNLEVILDVPVTLSMEVGRTRIPIRNLLQLNQGSVVELDRAAGEPLDVFVNGTLVAHGEVVVVNEKFGIRLTDVVSPAERIRKLK